LWKNYERVKAEKEGKKETEQTGICGERRLGRKKRQDKEEM
jgi:hypothetical protein